MSELVVLAWRAVALLGVALASGLAVRGGLGRLVLAEIDQPARRLVESAQSPGWNGVLRDLSYLGDATVAGLAAGCIAVGCAVVSRAIRPLAQIALAYGGAALFTVMIKLAVRRPPAYGPVRGLLSSTFPSGHAFIAAAVYGMAAILLTRSRLRPSLRRTITGFLVLLILTVALARVYLLVHYVSDVLAGLVFGMVWVAAIVDAERRAGRQTARAHGERNALNTLEGWQ
jgi:undecaprenyl-diphosphatase